VDQAAIIGWARRATGDAAADAAAVAETPWSRVFRISSHGKYFYLKQPVPPLMIETSVLRLCHAGGFAALPEIIAENEALSCFLMTDCGASTLRDSFAEGFDAARMAHGLRVYRGLQHATAAYIASFLAAGVPDWRIEKIAALYKQAVSDADFLKAEGLDDATIGAAEDAAAVVADRAAALAAFGLPQCLTHADLHDNNMVVDSRTGAISLVDLGETAVSHPFLSLGFCLGRTSYRYGLSADSEERKVLQEAGFGGWPLPAEDLRHAVALGESLAHVYVLLGHLRLMAVAGSALNELPRMRGRVKTGLATIVAAMKTPM